MKPTTIKVARSTRKIIVFGKVTHQGNQPTPDALFAQGNEFLTEIGGQASADTVALLLMAKHTERAIAETLVMLKLWAKGAPKESRAAWLAMIRALTRGVEELNRQVIAGDSQALLFAGRNLALWPCLFSSSLGLEAGFPDKKTLIKCLKLGEASPRKIAGAKWQIGTPTGKVANELWQLIHRVRRGEPLEFGLATSREERRARALAKRLPDFLAEGGWQRWSELAEQIVKYRLTQPAFAEVLLASVKAKSKLKGLGRRKAYLFTALRDRFKSMAGRNKTR